MPTHSFYKKTPTISPLIYILLLLICIGSPALTGCKKGGKRFPISSARSVVKQHTAQAENTPQPHSTSSNENCSQVEKREKSTFDILEAPKISIMQIEFNEPCLNLGYAYTTKHNTFTTAFVNKETLKEGIVEFKLMPESDFTSGRNNYSSMHRANINLQFLEFYGKSFDINIVDAEGKSILPKPFKVEFE
ncbi:MAG: hypothetical protein P1U56_05800 [Saprospiraceae bacterium]|nr:hypothetical protein [Saprospiraceae bacterium]